MSRDSYNTDSRLLDAIEAITGGNLDCSGECGNPAGNHPDLCTDPAVVLWRDGGREDELRAWLDDNRPGWREDAPLFWGDGELNVEPDECSHCGNSPATCGDPLSGDPLCQPCLETILRQGYFHDLGPEDKARLRRRIEDLLRKCPRDLNATAARLAVSGRIKWRDLTWNSR